MGFHTEETDAAYPHGGREARGKAGAGDRSGDPGGEPEPGSEASGAGDSSQEVPRGVLQLKRRQGQSSPVTTIWADLRKEAEQEPRHSKQKKRTSSVDQGPGGGGCRGHGPGERGTSRSADRGSARERAAQAGPLHRGTQSTTRPSLAPRCGALRPGGAHPPVPRPCVPEAAAWLPSTPGPSPTPPADSRPASGLQEPGPSSARGSDICSRAGSTSAARRDRLRKQPKAGRPRPPPGRAGRSRAEPAGRKGQRSGRRPVAGALGCQGGRRGRGQDYCVLSSAGF